MKIFVKRNRRVLIFGTVVILFLVGVGLIQLVLNQYQPFEDTAVVKVEDNKKDTAKEKETTVKTGPMPFGIGPVGLYILA